MKTEDKEKILIFSIPGVIALFLVIYAISIFGDDDETTQRQVANLSVPNADLEQQKKQYESKLEAYSDTQKKESQVEINFENPFASAQTEEDPEQTRPDENYDSLLQVIEKLKAGEKTRMIRANRGPAGIQKPGPEPEPVKKEVRRHVKTNPVRSGKKKNPPEPDNTTEPLYAIVPEDQEVRNGQRLTFRTTKAGIINGQKIPVNTTLFGITTFRNERVLVTITTIRVAGTWIHKTLSVYDEFDGMEGIYVPGSVNQEISKDVAREGIDNVTGRVNLPIGSVKLGTRKKLDDPAVRILRGYRIVVRPKEAISKRKPANPAQSQNAVATRSATSPPPATPRTPGPKNVSPEIAAAAESVYNRKDKISDIGVLDNKMKFWVGGIYSRDNHLFFKVTLSNDSNIRYDISEITFAIQVGFRKKKLKGESEQARSLDPVYVYNDTLRSVKKGERITKVFAFEKFTIDKKKKLFIRYFEGGGDRRMELAAREKDILKAGIIE